MDECLEKLDSIGDVDITKLDRLLQCEVIERNGYVEFVDNSNPYECIIIEDTAGTEGLENHIHLSDYIENDRGLILLKAGVILADLISERLKKNLPQYGFEILISYDPYHEDNLNDCIVRFHRIRDNENWIPDDLEKYKEHAVGVIRIDKPF